MLICFGEAAAQHEIKGLVLDSETGAALPGVHITISPTNGTLSQANGHFELLVQEFPVKVKFTYIGYSSFEKTYAATPPSFDTILLKPSSFHLNEIVVTAARQDQNITEVTQSMEVLKPEVVANTIPISGSDLVERKSSVQVLKGQANIRGGSGFTYGAGSRVLLMLDDMPLLSADAADVKWDYLPLENLDQIEIIKGASSALFGSAAMGGIIHLRTRLPGAEPQTDFKYYSGFYDKPAQAEMAPYEEPPFYQGFSLAHRRRIKSVALSACGNYFRNPGYRSPESDHWGRLHLNMRVTPSALPKWTFGAGGGWQRNRGVLFLFTGDMNNHLMAADGTTSYFVNSRWHVDQFTHFHASDAWVHKLRWRYYETENENTTGQAATSKLLYAEYQTQWTIQDTANKKTTLTFGINQIYSEVLSDSLYGFHTGSNSSLYLQGDHKQGRLNLSLGMRLEAFRVDEMEQEVFPVFRSGMNFKLATATFFRASYGQGFRYPSIAERFVRTDAAGLRIFPNPQLSPERGWSAEAGLRQGFQAGGWKGYLDGAAFLTEYDDMIEFLFGVHLPPDFDSSNTWEYLGFSSTNVTNARISGLELTGGLEKKWKHQELRFYGGITYIEPINLAAADTVSPGNEEQKYLKYRSKYLVKGQVDYRFRFISAGLYAQYTSNIINIDKEFTFFIKGLEEYREENQAGALVWDARISLQFLEQFRFSFLIKNITNEEYMLVPGNIMPPRTFNFQLEAKL